MKLEDKWPQTVSASDFVKRHDICMGSKKNSASRNSARASPSRLILRPYGCPGSLSSPCSSHAWREEGGGRMYVHLSTSHSNCGVVLQALSYFSWNAQGSLRTSAPKEERQREMACLKLLSSSRLSPLQTGTVLSSSVLPLPAFSLQKSSASLGFLLF